MLEKRLSFPKAAEYGKIIAKDKIVAQASPSPAVKKIFQSQIERIRCSHEITAESVNLASSQAVPKIFIIQILAKAEKIDHRILQAIDAAFKVPLIFEIQAGRHTYYSACYRRRSLADSSKWVTGEYFDTPKIRNEAPSQELPVSLSLENLYENLLAAIYPITRVENENIADFAERAELLRKTQLEMDKLQAKINAQKQFKIKVELNRQLNQLKRRVESLQY